VRANVYVDGFSLYYSALKGTPYKWLDLRKLSMFLLPDDRIHRIRYFTARIRTPSRLAFEAQHQQTYIRALMTLPRLTEHYGATRADSAWLPDSIERPREHARAHAGRCAGQQARPRAA
jgi:hypothetical protein